MGDKTDVLAINSHAECVGGHGDVSLTLNEALLHAVPCLGVHAAMVGDVLEVFFRESPGDFLDGFAGGAVDDSGAVVEGKFLDVGKLFLVRADRANVEGKVGPGES